VTVAERRHMGHLVVEIECLSDADADETSRILAATIQRKLSIKPEVVPVGRGTLPRFELKAKRYVRQ